MQMKNNIKKNFTIAISIMILSGCSKEYTYRIENNAVLIPETLLIPRDYPALPTKHNEEEVSKYILELYKNFSINKYNILQIKEIIENHNEDNHNDLPKEEPKDSFGFSIKENKEEPNS